MDHAELHALLTAEITSWKTIYEGARKALLSVLDIHRPNTVNHFHPCETHAWKPGRPISETFGLGARDGCSDCTSTPYVECSVTDDSYKGTPCIELRAIAEALGL